MNPSTTKTVDEAALAVISDIADRLEHSWNSADGSAYAEPFTDDADYITIQGTHLTGRQEVAEGAAGIFATIYRGSKITLRVTRVRNLSPSVIVAQIEHVLDVPDGPAAGVTTTLATVVVVDSARGWELAALHNTVALDPDDAG